MTPERLAEIHARACAAKAHELTREDEGSYDCPLCGNGYIDGKRYDAKDEAATVCAYGIGKGLKLAEEWVENGPDDMIELIDEVIRLQALLEAKP